MDTLLVLFLIVLGVNLVPAFGPPTWSIIVLYGLNTDLRIAAIILVGAAAAASGRFLLAWCFKLLGRRISGSIRENLAAARALFERNPRNGVYALSLFAISPVPSAQLFEAAGLAGVRILPFTLVFFAGRAVSYTIYAAGARGIRESSVGQIFEDSLSRPAAVLLHLAMIGALIALARIDWRKILDRIEQRETVASHAGDSAGEGGHG
ncbi:MAG: hypothetical protein J7496_01765 [Novosphingobium sp.]|nr:hypothetical protein [Novosphingobium sp.]